MHDDVPHACRLHRRHYCTRNDFGERYQARIERQYVWHTGAELDSLVLTQLRSLEGPIQNDRSKQTFSCVPGRTTDDLCYIERTHIKAVRSKTTLQQCRMKSCVPTTFHECLRVANGYRYSSVELLNFLWLSGRAVLCR